jgi:hypothetical protein
MFYHLSSIVLDIYELKKVKNHKTIELKGSMDRSIKSSNMQQSTIEVIQLFISLYHSRVVAQVWWVNID